MEFSEEWQAQLDASLAEFARLAVTAEDVDFTNGIVATAVLWPIRAKVKEFDGDVIDTLRQITGSRAKHIIRVMQGWDQDRLSSARALASTAEQNPELALALNTLNSHFQAVQTFAGHLARELVQQRGNGDVYNITEQIRAVLVNIGGVTSIDKLVVTIDLPAVLPPPWPGKRFWATVITAASLIVVIGLFVGWRFLNPPLGPMGNGFNVGVAEFTVLDDVTPPKVGMELSEWLFEAIVKETDQLPAALSVDTRGPKDIGVIVGADRESRTKNATAVAAKHNTTILIYGVVTQDDNGLQVQPEFYVRDEGFEYGSEVTGYEQLGHPITIDMTLDPGDRFELNDKLNARTQALQHLVAGLANFFIRRYDDAADDFQRAIKVDAWQLEEGKEVAYLLLGAAHLRAYDEMTNPDPLPDAKAAFVQAYELNKNYGRSYLGLGAVALEEAKIFNKDRTAIAGADGAKLIEARDWYSSSLRLTDQPVSAYIAAKAAYGLGGVYLVGFEGRVPGWSRLEAERFFNQVIAAYEAEPVPELAFYAGRSHAYIGRIAGHKYDYETMSAENRTAIEILRGLPGASPRHLIARYWAWVGRAEELAGDFDEARDAYRQAIEYGTGSASPQELNKWQSSLDRLGKGEP